MEIATFQINKAFHMIGSRRDVTPFLLHKLDISQFQNGVSLAIIAVHACSNV